MAKFKIQSNPTFKADVKIPRIGGDPITVPFTFKVLPRTELAALYDKWANMAKELAEQETESYKDMAEADIKLQMERIKDIVVTWGFDDPYNDENIHALVETSVQAAEAVLEAYQEAYSEARRGK
jgi:hypothetical protein